MIAAFEVDQRGSVWFGVNSETVVALSANGIVIDNSVPNNYGDWKPKEIRNPDWFTRAMYMMGWRPFVRSKR